jgi:hypothetical protein
MFPLLQEACQGLVLTNLVELHLPSDGSTVRHAYKVTMAPEKIDLR